MLNDYLARAHALAEAGRAFVVATVVRAHAPTSAKAGAKAIVTQEGTLEGWVGGACTQPAVIRESLKALQDGTPRYLRLGPPESLRGDQPGVIEVPLTCVSGGTLEIYLDPHRPAPQLLLVGHLPVVEALAALGADLNFKVTVAGEAVTAAQFPRADRVQAYDPAEPAALRVPAGAYAVVASHGHYDEPALEALLPSAAAYVALVASRQRGAAVRDYLRAAGLAPECLARLKCPAGLDLGAVTPEEIALSILAEIIQLRRRGPLSSPPFSSSPGQPSDLPAALLEMRPAVIPAPAPGEAVDPVCHMVVTIAGARYQSEYNGRTYYFCAPGCQRTFEKNPALYATA
ncbi:MAG: XdhC family protein [Anaerolineales bacterium]|nr:XdhC family protein [Anaerolineales bacterium]